MPQCKARKRDYMREYMRRLRKAAGTVGTVMPKRCKHGLLYCEACKRTA